jgi:hypothetical protein
MTREEPVHDPPTAIPHSASESLLHRQSQQQGPPQAPSHEVAAQPQRDIAKDVERDLGSAS